MGVSVLLLLAVLSCPLYGVASSLVEKNTTLTHPCTDQMKQAGIKCDSDSNDQEKLSQLNFSSGLYPLFSMKDLLLDGQLGKIVYYGNLTEALDYDSRQVRNCRTIDSSAECTRLKQTHLAFQAYPGQKMMRLELEVKIGIQMNVVLVNGACPINCVGGTNDCDIHKSDVISWSNTNKALIIHNLETSRFYCVRASIDGCCLICSETVELPKPTEEQSIEITGIPRSIVYFSVAVLVTVFLLMMLFAAKYAFDAYKEYRKRSLMDCTSIPFLNGGIEESPKIIIPMDLVDLQSILNPTDVLLLYSRESEEFSDVVSAFRILLTSYGVKIWDPLQREDIEDVSANPPAWLANLLLKRQLRIILVETEKTIRLEQSWIKNIPITSDDHHYLDSFFIYSLTCMHNPKFVHDYQKLFIIRFGYEGSETFVNFVPCARYLMPDHFDTLLRDIIGRDVNISLEDIARHQPALKKNFKFFLQKLK